jgi:hypothetical protein
VVKKIITPAKINGTLADSPPRKHHTTGTTTTDFRHYTGAAAQGDEKISHADKPVLSGPDKAAG